jgi:hypothetical protein
MSELIYLRAETGDLRIAGGALVVPVVALVGNIVLHAVNSPQPELVPLAAIAAAPHQWNQKPVCLGHPTQNGKQVSASDPRMLEAHGFGAIANARIDSGKLCADLHIDEAKAQRIGAGRVLARFRAGEKVEVSVGCFVQTAAESGQHNGKPYAAVWKTIIPDHIAVLEHSVGACSCTDGCGTYQRAAEYVAITDSYGPAIARLRAAQMTPARAFAERYAAERLAECERVQ